MEKRGKKIKAIIFDIGGGINAILFKNNSQLIRELNKLGVKI